MAILGDSIIKGDLNVLGNINGNHNIIDIKDFEDFDPKTLNMKAGDIVSFASQNLDNNYVKSNCTVTGFILRPRDDYQIYWLVSFATLNSTAIESDIIFIRKFLNTGVWSSWYTIPARPFVE